ncbi:MAG: tRNA (adenosine(37)-N6)-threonylcarbamoyltransferase complex dimerization subunit type 1 TsaB [Deltaproteobacteria bacterium RIFCSPLOWO2_12_FULL_40_28]|nr:MAG: tRNA (adenosine(37)-N6)-threonylcarbamoyltransferase complex dimerization subunit type 1 TsaB [Deltaproteobacteria bacterium RIFCSPHIGHO2_02_FULL_40_28]OGQ18956.1 MAG: tRNA (adenosine(37)-N6)-threonylcarbamoyltransferase complex dimerization subunit type 1 TsaB [Deltaproteobacteria bacterium RIFCSPHIGHO2_12_FULL_40_32]OGQ39499.1 MAG: tRNA (adenosine(37)-N6)-threonylcarbamoyltransferase complex dimerization subunit type 1 TsaB [Deltaproteobacteria bacterium RIFCSPLOWO2_02_FULL_40_36]OGQ53
MFLAVESSTKFLSIALGDEKKVWDEIILPPSEMTHSEKLLPAIQELLQKHHIHLPQLNGIFFSRGPGAYTSLRVGLSTCLGLALPSGLFLYPVSSLKAKCMGCEKDGLVVSVLRAGREKFYAGAWNKKGQQLECVFPESTFVPAVLEEKCKALGEEFFLLEPDLFPKASSQLLLHYNEAILPLSPTQATLDYLQPPDFGK